MSYISNLDELIQQLNEAKEHCVDGDTQVYVWSSDENNLASKDVLQGTVCYVDYDNLGVNLYFSKDE